ncbi:MAG: TetR family transcriptional regulator [Rhodobacter sp.]|nr:TetR family transcriptional regulator [Rhodobacter sp.]
MGRSSMSEAENKTGKGARVPLTPDRIVEAAFQVIEEVGLDEFSTRKLALKLHCEAMSIYHHFPSKAHLMDALVDSTLADLPPVPDDLPFPERVRVIFVGFRAVGLKRPSFFQFLSVHRLNTPFALTVLDRIIAEFRIVGFDDRTAAHLFRMLGYYVMGATLDETNGYAKGGTSVQVITEDDLRRDYPNVSAAGAYFSAENWDAIFHRGLNILLSEIETLARELPARKA